MKTANEFEPLTYDDIFEMQKKLEEQNPPKKKFIFHPLTVAFLNKHGYIRTDEDGRMYMQNYHQLPWVNGLEVISSVSIEENRGLIIDDIIFDGSLKLDLDAKYEKQRRLEESGYFQQTGRFKGFK